MPSTEDRFRGQVTGLIERSVMEGRGDNQTVWNRIKPSLEEAGLLTERGNNVLGRTGVDIVNQIRSRAVARRNGYRQFQRAAPEQIFLNTMAAPEENMRPAAERAILPEALARFDIAFINPAGDEESKTVSVRFPWSPGMTVGDVHDVVAEAAEGLALEYGQQLLGYANVRPVMI